MTPTIDRILFRIATAPLGIKIAVLCVCAALGEWMGGLS
jgi:hypothetical protein